MELQYSHNTYIILRFQTQTERERFPFIAAIENPNLADVHNHGNKYRYVVKFRINARSI